MKCGLLGEKLTHSYSPQIHRCIADYDYDLYEKQADEVADFLLNGDFTGINVTIPYKKTVLPYCAQLSDCAKRLGSVNTIVRLKDGTLFGHNTDYFGFRYLLEHTKLQVAGKKVLVLGSGGASVTVKAVLDELSANSVIISRNGPNNYENINIHADAAVIVNTTPVGMYPNNGNSPLDLSAFHKLEGVLDIIYNPSRTQLLLDAEKQGLVTENGLRMLVAQAVESAKYFTRNDISNNVIEDIYRSLSFEMENIILIGMPGSGKSSVGKALAECFNRDFVDADEEIKNRFHMTIPQIFEQFGETGFRKMETQVLQDLGKRSNAVIATGGGCVTIAENYPLLHQNGKIIWLQRELALLPTAGRPLSQRTDLMSMYQARKPLYQQFSNMAVTNGDSINSTVEQIVSALQRRTFDENTDN